MDALPSEPLIATLADLRLARRDEIARVARRVRRLAGDLASFDLAWIDALAQASLLTPMQADYLRVGRANELAVGRFVLYEPLAALGWAKQFRVRCRESGEWRRLYLGAIESERSEQLQTEFDTLIDQSRQLDPSRCTPLLEAVVEGACDEESSLHRWWAVTPNVAAKSAQQWLIGNGRLDPRATLEIAAQMSVTVSHLQAAGILHGDLAPVNVLIDVEGTVRLDAPGLRPIVRPDEGYAFADLPPDAYDTLAPERIEPSQPISASSEAYSLGACWCHLLTGRPPFAGGDSLTKLRNLQRAKWFDISIHAPDTDRELLNAIGSLTKVEAECRLSDFPQLAASLGESTPVGRKHLGQVMRDPSRPWRWRRMRHNRAVSTRDTFPWSTALIVLLAVLGGVGWPLWKNFHATQQQPWASVAELRLAPQTGTENIRVPQRLAIAEADPLLPAESLPEVAMVSHEREERPELLLATDRVHQWSAMILTPGTIVRPQGKGRAVLAVPEEGIAIERAGITFENIDFIGSEAATFLRLSAPTATFIRCTFRGDRNGRLSAAPIAIEWTGGDDSQGFAVGRTWRLSFVDCRFHALESAISVEHLHAAEIEATNTLVTSCEAMAAWRQTPASGVSARLTLANATLRDVGRLLVLHDARGVTAGDAGQVLLRLDDAVFDLGSGSTLVEIHADSPPLRMLQLFDSSGEGSLLAGDTPVLVWYEGDRQHPVREAQLSIDGLARTRVKFAGDDLRKAADSVAVDWYAPRLATRGPGIDIERLPHEE